MQKKMFALMVLIQYYLKLERFINIIRGDT